MDKIILITNVRAFLGGPAVSALKGAGALVACHDPGFADSAIRVSFAREHDVMACTATQPDEVVAEVIDRFGRLDVLISNDTTPAVRNPLEDIEIELLWENLNQLSVTPFLFARAATRHMKPRSSGKILFFTSAGPLRGLEGFIPYMMGRAATHALLETLALELAPSSISVNALAPIAPTYAQAARKLDPTLVHMFTSLSPMKRLPTREELEGVIRFLCSSSSDYMTGHVLPFSGGWQ